MAGLQNLSPQEVTDFKNFFPNLNNQRKVPSWLKNRLAMKSLSNIYRHAEPADRDGKTVLYVVIHGAKKSQGSYVQNEYTYSDSSSLSLRSYTPEDPGITAPIGEQSVYNTDDNTGQTLYYKLVHAATGASPPDAIEQIFARFEFILKNKSNGEFIQSSHNPNFWVADTGVAVTQGTAPTGVFDGKGSNSWRYAYVQVNDKMVKYVGKMSKEKAISYIDYANLGITLVWDSGMYGPVVYDEVPQLLLSESPCDTCMLHGLASWTDSDDLSYRKKIKVYEFIAYLTKYTKVYPEIQQFLENCISFTLSRVEGASDIIDLAPYGTKGSGNENTNAVNRLFNVAQSKLYAMLLREERDGRTRQDVFNYEF